ncbi:MAG: RpiB/LacA/LacB family sugar-phosphate isomerase [Thermoprotei archaeon]
MEEHLRVAVGSDDTYSLAEYVVKYLEKRGFRVIRVGALKTGKPYPWPLVGKEVGELVANGRASWGVVICYTGTGVSISANKIRGVRAALCPDAETARGARLWNDANVLALSARLTTEYKAREILDTWIAVQEIDKSEEDNIKLLKELDK